MQAGRTWLILKHSSLGHGLAPESIRVPAATDEFSDSGSDASETAKPYPVPLERLEAAILQSDAFDLFRRRYRVFIFSSSSKGRDGDELPPALAPLVTGISNERESVDVMWTDREIHQHLQPAEGFARRTFLAAASGFAFGAVLSTGSFSRRFGTALKVFAGKLMRPRVRMGYERLEWICVRVSEQHKAILINSLTSPEHRIVESLSTAISRLDTKVPLMN